MSLSLDPVPKRASTTAPPAAGPPPRTGLRALIGRLHFYAGLLVGPFILIAALTGALYALAPTVERVLYADQLIATGSGPAQSLDVQVRAAQHTEPALTVTSVLPGEGDRTTRVLLADPALTDGRSLAVFVDPATARVQGALPVYGSTEQLPFRFWLDRLHVNLHLGEFGRNYSELAASWLWLIALGGAYLWWRRWRAAPHRRTLLTPGRAARGREATAGRHGALGAWLLVGLLFFSVTGLTWSVHAGANVAQLRAELDWTKPAVTPTLPAVPGSGGANAMAAMPGMPGMAAGEHAGHAGHSAAPPAPSGDAATVATNVAALDGALHTARTQGVSGPVAITVPSSADQAITVTQTRQPWRLGISSVAIDPHTLRVVDAVPYASWPLMAKAAELAINIHQGSQFGVLNQIALALFGFALATGVVLGYRMWWQRRPRRPARAGPRRQARGKSGRRGRLPRPPTRGAWRRADPAQLVIVVGVLAFVGWFVPLLGISLLAFGALDLLIGAIRNGLPYLKNSV